MLLSMKSAPTDDGASLLFEVTLGNGNHLVDDRTDELLSDNTSKR